MMTKRPTKILVVDGDEAVLRAIGQILTRDGHQVVAISEPEAGLVASRDPSIDVAILDIGMSSPSGMAVLASVQAKRPDLEILVLTTRPTAAAAVGAVKGGAYDCLIKPFDDVEEVGLAVARAIERKAVRDRAIENLIGDADSPDIACLTYAQAKRMAVRAFERRYLTALLERTKFNISSAARAAGVDRSNFRRLLKQYDIVRGKLADGAEGPERATSGSEEAA